MQYDLSGAAFDSRYRYERVGLKGHVDFSTSGFFVSVTVSHNLGYVPYYKAYAKLDSDDNYYYLSSAGPNILYGTGSSLTRLENFFADTINLYCTFDNFTPGTLSGSFFYRIYEEPQS